MSGKNPHAKKVEFQGNIIEVKDGDFYLSYRNPKQRWLRVGSDPKAAWLAAEKKRAELASVATGREERPQELGQVGIRIGLEDARDFYLNDLRRTRAEDTTDLFVQTLTEFTTWMSPRSWAKRRARRVKRPLLVLLVF